MDASPFGTLSMVYFHLFGQIPPPTEGAVQQILNKIGHTLVERNAVLVVCLDDAYSLLPDKALNSILFLLLQTGTRHPGADLAIVASANTIGTDFSGYIDPYVMSLFHPVEISFPPYSRDEIKSILQDRVRRALVPGAVPDEVLDVVADRAASCGDIRMGLDLAWIDLLGRIVFTNPNCVRLC